MDENYTNPGTKYYCPFCEFYFRANGGYCPACGSPGRDMTPPEERYRQLPMPAPNRSTVFSVADKKRWRPSESRAFWAVLCLVLGMAIGSAATRMLTDAGPGQPAARATARPQSTLPPAEPSASPAPALPAGGGAGEEMTPSQRAAVEAARGYLDARAFSRPRLVAQLREDGFPEEDAAFAADRCGADWNAQAQKAAAVCLEARPYSLAGLKRQLEETEGFTAEEADYGARYVPVSWFEQAARSARRYLDTMPFTRDALIAQLEFEGFTHEQAVFGADQNDF